MVRVPYAHSWGKESHALGWHGWFLGLPAPDPVCGESGPISQLLWMLAARRSAFGQRDLALEFPGRLSSLLSLGIGTISLPLMGVKWSCWKLGKTAEQGEGYRNYQKGYFFPRDHASWLNCHEVKHECSIYQPHPPPWGEGMQLAGEAQNLKAKRKPWMARKAISGEINSQQPELWRQHWRMQSSLEARMKTRSLKMHLEQLSKQN